MSNLPFYITERENLVVKQLLSAEKYTENGESQSYTRARLHCIAAALISTVSILFQSVICSFLTPINFTASLFDDRLRKEFIPPSRIDALTNTNNLRLVELAERLILTVKGIISPDILAVYHAEQTAIPHLRSILESKYQRYSENISEMINWLDQKLAEPGIRDVSHNPCIKLNPPDINLTDLYNDSKIFCKNKLDELFKEIDLTLKTIETEGRTICEDHVLKSFKEFDEEYYDSLIALAVPCNMILNQKALLHRAGVVRQ